MIRLTLEEAARAMGARLIDPPRGAAVCGVSTDSRTTSAGELFFAIPGERFDGHAFVGAALRRGAMGAVISGSKRQTAVESLGTAAAGGPAEHNGNRAAQHAADAASETARAPAPLLLEVDDPLAALGRLAAFHRRLAAAQVIAVAGSNGKTTTKAMIDHVLSGSLRGRCSPKSFNNAIGVPLTLLSCEPADDYLVVEIGTNAPGEVAALAALAAPDAAAITSLAEEHLEGLGDLRGVVAEETSILWKLRRGGFLAANIECALIRPLLIRDDITTVRFGRDDSADLRISDVRYAAPWLHFSLNGRFAYRLPLAGAHNALNATAAIAVARRLGIAPEQIAERLESFRPPPMRGEIIHLGEVTLINDAYNANPGSMAVAIDMLEGCPCRGARILVVGEMRELGPRSAELHAALAERIAAAKLDQVVLVGTIAEWMPQLTDAALSVPKTVHRCADVPAAAEHVAALAGPGDVILLKASRAVGLERIEAELRRRGEPAAMAG